MIKLILRIIGTLAGCAIFFIGLMPHIGLVTDWETISGTERLINSLISGLLMGLGGILITISTSLLSWIVDHID